MELFNAIAKRHSYRGSFKDIAITKQDLQKIVQAGIDAPSGCNAQTTSFIIVDDEKILDKLNEIVSGKAMNTAKAVIVVLSYPIEAYYDMSFAKEDYSAAVENILLAVTALGYATVWIDGQIRREEKAEKIARLLDVPNNLIVRVVLPIGVPKVKKEQKAKLPFNERAWFNGYKK
ncbi:MAG: nitroreductase family protein [Clostridiales bacterium]|nr:nitroreductase family protein [Clostridiales bacterium]